MANQKKKSINMLSPKVRLSYPKLVVAEFFKDPNTGAVADKATFTTELLCPDDEIAKFRTWDESEAEGKWVYNHIHNFCKEAALDHFGPDFDVNETIKHGGISWPVQSSGKYITDRIARSGGRLDEEKLAHYDGHFIVKAKALAEINGRAYSPTLSYYNEAGERVTLKDTTSKDGISFAESKFYGGAWAVLELSAVAGAVGQNKYVTLYINHVIFISDDEKFGGGPRLADRFEGIAGGASDYDPTQGMDDVI